MDRRTVKHLLQFEHLLLVLFVGGLALVEQSLPLLLQPADLLLQPALLLVQVPDGGLVGHLRGLQRADLTWEQSHQRPAVNTGSAFGRRAGGDFKIWHYHCSAI